MLRIGLWDRDELLQSHIDDVDFAFDPSFVQIHGLNPEDGAGGGLFWRRPAVDFQ